MKKMLSIFGLLLLVVSFQACKSDEEAKATAVDSKYYTAAQNDIVILKDDAIQYIQEKVETDSLIVFSNSTPDGAVPQVGTKIFIPVSDKTPYGFLGKVSSIEHGNPIKVFTEALPLEEAFESLSVDTTMNIMDKIEGVYDADGNKVEYELVDSTLSETSTSSKAKGISTRAHNYWQGGVIKFPFTIGEKETGSENTSHELNGLLYAEIKNFDFNVDIVNNEIKYIDVEADPTLKISVTDESKISSSKKNEHKKLLGTVNCAPITIPTPIAIPIILRPKFYMYLIWGAKGEITASLSLQYQCSFETEMHYRKGNGWDNKFYSKGLKNENPWTVTEFDMSGELYAGCKLGMLVGLYSATTGIGVNVSPKVSLSADAKLSTENLLDINPQVEIAAKADGDLYFTASLFKKPIAKYSFSSPEYVLWSEKMYLLPQFNEFTAIGASSSGEISYQIDSHYFLSLLGVKTGAKVYESDKKTEFNTYYPSPTNTDNKGNKYYNLGVTGLSAGNTYYASPVCSWLGFTWPMSKKYEFTTEASYHAGFRCSGQSYDNIYFDFNISEEESTSLDQTLETQDYTGGLERIHFTAQYDASTKQLSGVIDYHFYDSPEERRQDGFTITLPIEDTGYVSCTKVIANGGCDKLVRIYKNSSSKAKRKTKAYNKPIGNAGCNVGDHLLLK